MPDLLRVTCALIEEQSRVLLAQRAAGMALAGKWEFPGGKIDGAESPAECLRREIREELGCEIAVGAALTPVEHAYPDGRTLLLLPFLCRMVAGEPQALEHAALAWARPEELAGYDLAEADRPVLREYLTLRAGERDCES